MTSTQTWATPTRPEEARPPSSDCPTCIPWLATWRRGHHDSVGNDRRVARGSTPRRPSSAVGCRQPGGVRVDAPGDRSEPADPLHPGAVGDNGELRPSFPVGQPQPRLTKGGPRLFGRRVRRHQASDAVGGMTVAAGEEQVEPGRVGAIDLGLLLCGLGHALMVKEEPRAVRAPGQGRSVSTGTQRRECRQRDRRASASRLTTVTRPRPRVSVPSFSSRRSTRLTVALVAPARPARSSWVKGMSAP